jgi:regulation of enolase protein 1 (concanavalin A-like superfamily)
VGNPALVGDQSLSSGTWTVKGSGQGTGGTSDQLHLVSQPVGGDVTLSAQVTGQSSTQASAQTGVMLRAGTDPGSAYYGAWLTPSQGIQVSYRDTDGIPAAQLANPTGSAPAWLEVARSGDTFTTYTSSDGSTWAPVIGSTIVLPNLAGTLQAGLAVSSTQGGALDTATLQTVSLMSGAPASPNACPSGFTCRDVGYPAIAGSQYYNAATQTWTVQGAGNDISGGPDQFRFISQAQTADGSVSAQVNSQAATDPWAKSGVMVRLSDSPYAPYYAALVTPNNGVAVEYRSVQGGGMADMGGSGVAPIWLQVTRSGTTFTAYASSDGVNWTLVPGSGVSIPALTGSLEVGLVVCSHNPQVLGTALFAGVSITGTGAGGFPGPWSDSDIGGATPTGSASYTNQTFTISGGGADIWGSTDQFNYLSQPLSGDTSIVARVTSQTPTDPWARAGVMIKQSTAAGSPYALVAITPGNGLVFQYGFSQSISAGSYSLPNAWVRLDRVGNLFLAYWSKDGFNWVRFASATVAMPNPAMVGLVVSSHSQSTLSTGTFDSVAVIPSGGGPLPAPWSSSDVGSPALPGSSSYQNGVFTLNGAGADIWGSDDQFQYSYQTLAGDGSITARVLSQTPTDPWAKAGVMIKQSASPGSPYALVAVTPGNGVNIETGFDTNIAGGGYSYPVWVRLTRTGSTLTGYSSADGATWTAIGSVTVSVTSPVTIGLFVTSRNATELSTVSFDNVAVVTAGGPLPSPWSATDVGSPSLAGSSSYQNGVFTVSGSGTDIWGTADQFQYVDQTLTADGSITARVTSQSDTDPWAKAGLMVKQSTTAGSSYALLAVTPGNGVNLQSGFSTHISGGGSSFPTWLRLTKVGGTLTGYTSPDGATWTEVGAVSVSLTSPATIGLFVTAHNAQELSTATFDNVTVAQSQGNPVPSPWSSADVGSPTLAGSASYQAGVFTVNGEGTDIWGTADQFHYVYQTLASDASITARVTSQTNTSSWAKAGVMIKQSTTAGSAYTLLGVTPGNGVAFQWGYSSTLSGGSYSFPNAWLRLVRSGSTITAYTSSDGTTWTSVGSTSVSLTDPVTVGLFVTSHNGQALSTATFDNVLIVPLLPSPWSSTDVGSPTLAGSASYQAGVFTVNGEGTDIWGTADQFHYVYQTLSADATITARVTSQTNKSSWAKAGVMIKQSTTTGSAYALLGVTPGNGATFQWGYSHSLSGGSYSFPNAWLRLVRSGSAINAYTSSDGNTWTLVGSTSVNLIDPVTIGLFVTSHNTTALSTATFDNVSVTSGALPSPWTSTPIGTPPIAGSASYQGGVFTVSGSGSDIWGSNDQFHYVDQTLSGNATITARVTSQTDTSSWAKAGVMIKQSTTAGSAYALLGVTPGNGVTFQWGYSHSLSGGSYSFPNAWLRLVRAGGTISAYTSNDGTTWILVGSTSVSLTDPVTIGLFVTSHSTAALSTATFDTVSVTSP